MSDEKPKNLKIAIIGINRFFCREHRIRNEVETFREKYAIDGYGSESVSGIDDFFFVKRPHALLRRFVILAGGFLPWFRILFEGLFYRKYVKQINSKKYRFIIPHHIDDALVAMESGAPFVFHSHEYLPRQFDGSRLFRFTEIKYRHIALKKILSRAVLTIVEGDKVARKYSETYDIPLDRFIVMPSMPRYHVFKSDQKVEGARTKLIHHGLLVPERGIDLLMDIVTALGSSYHLTLMGPGPPGYLDELKARVSTLSNIEVRDPVLYDEIVETLNGYDLGLVIFGSPHYHHKYMTVPNKFWECLQARVPVLVSPESAMIDHVRESGCGIVADSATIDGYVSAIRSLSRQSIVKMKSQCETLAWSHSRNSWLNTYRDRIENEVSAYYERHNLQ